MIQNPHTLKNIGIFRHFFAITYDTILLLALLILASYFYFVVAEYIFSYSIDDVNKGIPYKIYIFGVTYLYFVFPWLRSGQTLGMRTWNFCLKSQNNQTLTLLQANNRFFLALLSWLILGLGFLARLFNRQQLTLHDRLSSTYLAEVID